MKTANQFIDALIVMAIATCFSSSILLADYPESSNDCYVTADGSTCKNLGGSQCIVQGTGVCYKCLGATMLPDPVCLYIVGLDEECSGDDEKFCGTKQKGKCTPNENVADRCSLNLKNDGNCKKTIIKCDPDA